MTSARRSIAVLLVAALTVLVAACGDDSGDAAAAPADGAAPSKETTTEPEPGPDGEVRLNQLQSLGSHNSYKLRPAPEVLAGVGAVDATLAEEIDYEHRPLTEQLVEHGIRQLEIDVHADPDGGRFADRPALEVVGLPTESGMPELDEPGFKVMHTADIDFESTCWTLVSCLSEVEAWSSSEPDHLPLMIMIETKTMSLAELAAEGGIDIEAMGVPWTEVLPMSRELFDDLEAEIVSVFDEDQIITPDDVRGDHDTLDAAVRTGEAWPTLDEARGKVLFSLVDLGENRDLYVGDATTLEGRLMFSSSEEGRPDAAFLRIDDAIEEGERIEAAVAAGYLVRTRTDIPAQEAVTGDTTRRDAALASGAHYLSTDHYVEDPELGTGYVVALPDSPPVAAARCNPVATSPACEDVDLTR
jgi:hypothetical protein